MTFEARVLGFADRFLSDRSFRLIVEPAIADLQFERCAGSLRRAANRLAVLRAVSGGVRDDLARVSGGLFGLMLLPACYHIFLLVLCFDVFSISISTDFVVISALILVLSFGPVVVCFWPGRRDASSAE
jgi:hypothetical protein